MPPVAPVPAVPAVPAVPPLPPLWPAPPPAATPPLPPEVWPPAPAPENPALFPLPAAAPVPANPAAPPPPDPPPDPDEQATRVDTPRLHRANVSERICWLVRPARRLYEQKIALPAVQRVFMRSAAVYQSVRSGADGRKLHALLRIGLAE